MVCPQPSSQHGYSGTPLIKKLGVRSETRVFFANAPKHFAQLLGPLPVRVKQLARVGKNMDYIHIFAREQKELERKLPSLVKALAKDGVLWISWPKKTSTLALDLTGSEVRSIGLASGLVDIKVCAVDEDWSGHKFCYRERDR